MDREELERIAGNIGRILDQGGPESDVLAYLQSEGFESRDAWLQAYRAPVNTGPTPQPPFPTLPPLVGGALDALVAFGAGTGLPQMLSQDSREYVDELKARSPGGTRAAQGAGLLATLPIAAAGAGAGATAARMGAANPGGFAISHGPGLIQRGAAAAGNALRNRIVQGGGLLGAYELLRRNF